MKPGRRILAASVAGTLLLYTSLFAFSLKAQAGYAGPDSSLGGRSFSRPIFEATARVTGVYGANSVESAVTSTDETAIKGVASWYGPGFHGRKTANGEVYDQNLLTAAHRHLPFGTVAKVTNLENGREVLVRINDRGPFVNGREIDLSYRAAQALGMVEDGVVPVRIDLITNLGRPE
jgi:rare lipoprotein A (peptidoglycan hydrolase)